MIDQNKAYLKEALKLVRTARDATEEAKGYIQLLSECKQELKDTIDVFFR